MRRFFRGISLALLFYALSPASSWSTEKFIITSVSPQGLTKNVRQISLRFSMPVVDFGDPRDRIAPVIDPCGRAGTARWIDPKNWIFEFEKPLPTAIRCRFKIRNRLKSKSGENFGGPKKEFEFWTGGASVARIKPYNGKTGIAEDQVFVLTLDAVADRNSVIENSFFDIEGVTNPVIPHIINPAEANQILDQMWFYGEARSKPKLLLRSPLRFPRGKKVALVWKKNIQTPNGLPTGYRKDRIFRYQVREPFGVSVQCRRITGSQKCDPLGRVYLRFNNYVDASSARTIDIISDGGQSYRGETTQAGLTKTVTFDAPFQPNENYRFQFPSGFTDDDGQKPHKSDNLPIGFKTGNYPPLAKFSGRFGILESNGNAALPITVRNLENLVQTKRVVSHAPEFGLKHKIDGLLKSLTGRSFRFGPDRAQGSAEHRRKIVRLMRLLHGVRKEHSPLDVTSNLEPRPFKLPRISNHNEAEVIGIPMEKPGFYLLELSSHKLADAFLKNPKKKGKQPDRMYVQSGALVTNMAVHLKHGRENSLVWVTSLGTGEVVEGAKIYALDCSGKTLFSAITNVKGVATLKNNFQKLITKRCEKGVYHSYNKGFFVFAEKEDDVSFVHTSWNKGIETWRYPTTHRVDSNIPFIGHMVADRGLYRAGETAHMKFFMRKHGSDGITIPKNFSGWPIAEIEHQGSRERYRFKLTWDRLGIAEATWKIPKGAKLGEFKVYLTKDLEKRPYNALQAGSLKIQEYKVPLSRAVIDTPKEKQIRVSKIPLTLSVNYLAGGDAAGLPIRVRSQIKEKKDYFRSKIFDSFQFNLGAYALRQSKAKMHIVKHHDIKLDETGVTQLTLDQIPIKDAALSILAELEHRDPMGEVRTTARRITIYPSKWNIGIHAPESIGRDRVLSYRVALRDLNDQPIRNQQVAIRLSQHKTLSHRKKIAGGLYAYENVPSIKDHGVFCEGMTDERGLYECERKTELSGNIVAEAEISAPEGFALKTHVSSWVPGEDHWWFDLSATDRMDILPDKKTYTPNEIAQVQVRMPFKSATALVTYEREGVLDYKVEKLSGRYPVVHIPLKQGYAPNVYVGVLAVRGRASDVRPTAMIDLGRPAYRFGLTEVKVGWKKHRLQVEVEPEKSIYQVRDQVRASIKVKMANGAPLANDAEVAIAVVDEGLLLLSRNKSWDLLEHILSLRNNEVATATAQMQVIGKRHFGQKTVPPGGGGGVHSMRELFDTLVYWKGRVKLDQNGTATISFPLNDSLTKFRIAAIASAGADKFGTGYNTIQSSKDLMVFSGLTSFVREGDKTNAVYTFRNTTKRSMHVSALLSIDGLETSPEQKSFDLEAGKSRIIQWPIVVPNDQEKLVYRLKSRIKGKLADELITNQIIKPAVAVRTLQGTFSQITSPFNLPISRPASALPGRGGVKLTFNHSIVGSLAGVRDYMKQYSYSCFEQELSKSIALNDHSSWETLISALPTYLDQGGLLKYFPAMPNGNDILSSYFLRIVHEKGWSIPAGLEKRMLDGLTAFVSGRRGMGRLFNKRYNSVRKLSAIEALSRYGRAEPKMLESIQFEPAELPTSALIDWFNILNRIDGIKDRSANLSATEQLIKNRIRFKSRMLEFSHGIRDDTWWFMSGRNSNASRIILTLLEFGLWRDELPKFVVGTVARQQRGHWGMTTANAWGTLALERFAKSYERAQVSGKTHAVLGSQSYQHTWSATQNTKSADSILLPWPEKNNSVKISHNGSGAPWVTLQSRAALPFVKPFNAGFNVKKIVTPLRQKTAGKFSVGDLVRVRLEINSGSSSTWVVVNDPVPPGAIILGRGLGGESASARHGEKRSGEAWLAYQERASDAFRSYYEFVRRGEWSLEYTIRLNAAGTFNLPETRVEAMYNPDLFGVFPNEPVKISE